MSSSGPTLGEQAARARATTSRPARAAGPPERDATARALGAGLGLLATFAAAIAFAFVTSRLVGGIYVTFAMPLFVGTLIAAFASIGPKRFSFGDRKALIGIVLAGVLVCWIGQHLLAYLRIIDIVSGAVGTASAEGVELALRKFEAASGDTGLLAYLGYVSRGDGALYSPIGLVGRLEPGAFGTILIMLSELGLMGVAASWSILFRTRHLRRGSAGPLAWFDAATAEEAAAALRERRLAELALIIARATGDGPFALVMEEGESAADVAIFEYDGAEAATRKATRLVPLAAAATLRRNVERALAARSGGTDGPHDA